MIHTKLLSPSQNGTQKFLLDSSDIISPFILWMYLQFSPKVCQVILFCGTPTKFVHFKRNWLVAKSANYISRARSSVCPSDRCHWTDFLEIDSGDFHNCLARNANISLKPDRNMSHLAAVDSKFVIETFSGNNEYCYIAASDM